MVSSDGSNMAVTDNTQDQITQDQITQDQITQDQITQDLDMKAHPLKNNIQSEPQSADLPLERPCPNSTQQSMNDDNGILSPYASNPLLFSVVFIITMELLASFSFFGLVCTQTSYLTGSYDEYWNAGMSSVEASSYAGIASAIAFTAPFLGAVAADCFLGDFYGIILITVFVTIPGLMLVVMTTIPNFLGDSFDRTALTWGMLVLYPLGTGCTKSVINVFGAKQYHPQRQSAKIESYYVTFYICSNAGALAGGIVIPILAESDVTVAYSILPCVLAVAVLAFVLGAPRYVRTKPRGNVYVRTLKVLVNFATCGEPRESKGGRHGDDFVKGVGRLLYVFPICMLTLPFNIALAPMPTTFVVQGTVMENVGFIDAAMMQNVDALSVILSGVVIANYFYPALAKRGIRIPTTYKFAIGSFFSVLSLGSVIIIDRRIHYVYQHTGNKISILWQTFPFALLGAGEIFAISAAFEAAFTIAPKEQKAMASAVSLFVVGGLSNIIPVALCNWCHEWFQNDRGDANIASIEAYTQAHLYKYFWLVFGIAVFGTVVNAVTPVRDWVTQVETDNSSPTVETDPHTSRGGDDDTEDLSSLSLPLLFK